MKLQLKKIVTTWVAIIISTFLTSILTHNVGATGFTVSPMKQDIVLSPGDSYQTSMTVANPGTNDYDIDY